MSDVNLSKHLELAQIKEMVDAGLNTAETCVNFFWVASSRPEAKFPQISGATSPDIPDGSTQNSFSMFRVIRSTIKIVTLCDADENRSELSRLYSVVRNMIEAANSGRHAWQTETLVGFSVDGVTITDSPVPSIEQLDNGAWAQVLEISSEWMVSKN